MKFTIEELKLADELCFPENFERLGKEIFGERFMFMEKKVYYKHKILSHWILNFTRDCAKEIELSEKMICKIIGKTWENIQ